MPAILADADQLRQVVLNLVLNAAEAMAERGGALRLSSRGDVARARIEFRCADTGPGLTEEVRTRMFEPFFTTKKTGTGLGLSIAYGIVERHQGEIVVEPTPGGGTTFVIALPISGADNDD